MRVGRDAAAVRARAAGLVGAAGEAAGGEAGGCWTMTPRRARARER
nr:MAG TPA: hypothetical protein [Caudoviricetes sp.]